jgi:histidinol phosphatase-like PHP family hydrolase
MYDSAVEAGLTRVLFSEHARRTSTDWFGRFAAEVRALPSSPCEALVGVETKVADFKGNIDCDASIIGAADLVMASVHRFPGENGQARPFDTVTPSEAIDAEFRLADAVLDNPDIDILGHPFGMCLRRFKLSPPEALVRCLMVKAASRGIAFEINPYYHPDPWGWIQLCREEGAVVSLGSNAHEKASVGRIVRVLEGSEAAWKL